MTTQEMSEHVSKVSYFFYTFS